MALVSNWVTNLGRGKKRTCELASWGLGFPGIPGVTVPDTVSLTFRDRHGMLIEVDLNAAEVEMVAGTIKDFRERNAKKNHAS